MLVWDASINRFADFGSNQEIAKAAKEGLDSDRQLCYVAFDILYVGDTSVIHQCLKERHHLLKKVVNPIAGRLEILVPDGGLNLRRAAGEPCCSLLVPDADSVERFFKETVENRDEGIVLKELNSKWEPGDRSGKWLKLKPDYVHAGSELDVLIIGGYYGSGRHGGEVAQFLVGLAERPAPNTYPRRFVSFCRVGTGLSDEELKAVVSKLKPYFRKYEYPKPAPTFYEVTNNSKERPDVWVESPEKSFIVSITSDIRTIRSEVFSAPYSLRFPRIDKVRYDKPWYECLDVQSFVELVHSTNGATQRTGDLISQKEDAPRGHAKGVKKKNISVPLHFIHTDVSHVKGETSIFSNMTFYFANVPSSTTLESLHKRVVENGGSFSMNLNSSVTHCVASEIKGIKFQAARRVGDVINVSWFSECCSQRKLLLLQPKYFLYLSDASRKKLEEEIDEFCDSYYFDVNAAGLLQILRNIDGVGDSKAIEHYKRKLCPRSEWMWLHGYCIYFHLPKQLLKNKCSEIVLEFSIRRMKNETCFRGGRVTEMLSCATHLVVVSDLRTDVEFETLLTSLSQADRLLLQRKRLQFVRSQWLEDCFEQGHVLPETNYSIKSQAYEESWREEEAARGLQHGVPETGSPDEAEKEETEVAATENEGYITLPARRGKGTRKATGGNSVKPVVGRSLRSRLRAGNKPAKIDEHDSDNVVSGEKGLETTSSSAISRTRGSVSNQPKRKRAQLRSKPARICVNGRKDDSADCESDHEPSTANREVECLESKEREESEALSSRGIVGGQETADPVQAMLLNMVPALSQQRESFPENAKESSGPDVAGEPSSSSRPEIMPVKKKKVSYKDVADQLLKDW